MKRRKNKGAVVAIVASLSTVSLVSVGFAAWLISGGDKADISGNITAEELTDSRYLILRDDNGSPEYIDSTHKIEFNRTIHFGPTGTIANAWLTYNDGATEALDAYAYLWVGNVGTNGISQDKTMIGNILKVYPITVVDNASTNDNDEAEKFNDAVDAHLVASLATPTLETTSASAVEKDGVTFTQYKLTAKFGWGSAFIIDPTAQNPVASNPYVYYNTKYTGANVTNDVKTEANQRLSAIADFSGVSFTFAIRTGDVMTAYEAAQNNG